MPVTILSESDAALDAGAVSFVSDDTGELTLESTAILSFLQFLDFSPVFQMEGIDDLLLTGRQPLLDEDGDDTGEIEDVVVLPGAVASQLIDHEDLMVSLDTYATLLAEAAEEGTLEEKATAAALLDALGYDAESIEEAKKKGFKPPYKKGTFKKMHKRGKAFANKAVRSILAMLHKGIIKRTKDGYKKAPGYRKGGTPSGKKQVALYTNKNAAKIKKAKKKALSASDQGVYLVDLDGIVEAPEWGLGIPFGQALFTVAVSEAAYDILEMYKGKMKGKKGMKGYKAMKGKKDMDMDYDASNASDASEGKKSMKGKKDPDNDGDMEYDDDNDGDGPMKGKKGKKGKKSYESVARPRNVLLEGATLAGKIQKTLVGRGGFSE